MSVVKILVLLTVALIACSSVKAEQISAPRSPHIRNLYLDAIPDKFYREAGGDFYVFPGLNSSRSFNGVAYYSAIQCINMAHESALDQPNRYYAIANRVLHQCKQGYGWPKNWPSQWPESKE